MSKPLAIDLFCGLGGWTEGLLAEGYDVIGFDIERHVYSEHRYLAQLVLQDVMTIHGSQLKDADLIVASPPCQEYSYMAMPWTLAKKRRAEYLSGERDVRDLTALFDACFRIQREACEAAGHHIPMIVENVRGANEWVGRSRWNFGSFHFWGDVPALMPMGVAVDGAVRRTDVGTGARFTTRDCDDGIKNPGMNWSEFGKTGLKSKGFNVTNAQRIRDAEGIKVGGDWFSDPNSPSRQSSSRSNSRKFAAAMIAKIPLAVSSHIAKTFHPNV